MTQAQVRRRIRMQELLSLLKISRSTAYRRFDDGTLPAPHKIGGLLYFYEDEIEAHLSGGSDGEQVAA